eukprot:CAMPEP_0116876610 /NCGR_PEP_ID=MMETSP0463-20121206/8512_1 /TAXON_ID=181622 /ORGANISM="Strombidinopsis sp, Strain SopsisLIS2011" /LENGTH=101 /DNA_ID=CAMNT_0004523307 /DNA_START=223 /DNA_END=529 /DNA_ORIENTATION=-
MQIILDWTENIITLPFELIEWTWRFVLWVIDFAFVWWIKLFFWEDDNDCEEECECYEDDEGEEQCDCVEVCPEEDEDDDEDEDEDDEEEDRRAQRWYNRNI